MISIKPGARIRGLRPEAWAAVDIAYSLFRDAGVADLMVTDGTGGQHKPGSRHYVGLAVDIGIRDVGALAPTLRSKIADALGADYDVVLEATHIHIEHDPKEK